MRILLIGGFRIPIKREKMLRRNSIKSLQGIDNNEHLYIFQFISTF